jgi:hypothetical protein
VQAGVERGVRDRRVIAGRRRDVDEVEPRASGQAVAAAARRSGEMSAMAAISTSGRCW